MFTVICVYNNKKTLNSILLNSLKHQSCNFELITIDNTKNDFKSAASAYNFAAEKATGKYLMFIHQDIELGTQTWLSDTEKILDNIPNLGIAGIAGAKNGNIYGYLNSAGSLWGAPISSPIQVQTLDGCLLIIPKKVFNMHKFDEHTFDGWHGYDIDYCLSTSFKTYVIPAFIYHRTIATNNKNLGKYFKRIYTKHKLKHKHIYVPGDGNEITLLKIIFMYISPIYNLIPKVIRNLLSPVVEKVKLYVWKGKDIF